MMQAPSTIWQLKSLSGALALHGSSVLCLMFMVYTIPLHHPRDFVKGGFFRYCLGSVLSPHTLLADIGGTTTSGLSYSLAWCQLFVKEHSLVCSKLVTSSKVCSLMYAILGYKFFLMLVDILFHDITFFVKKG